MKKSTKSKEGATKKSPTSKSSKKADSVAPISMIVDYVFLVALKSILSSVIQHIPIEILKECSQYINSIYPAVKDRILNATMKDDTVKKKEKVWGLVTKKILDVLHPLILATNSDQKPLLDIPDPSITDRMNSHSPRTREEDSSTLNYAIKVYAQHRSAEKKMISYIGPSL
jgi:hypothetical protein